MNRRSFVRRAATLPLAAGVLSISRPGALLAQTPSASPAGAAAPELPVTITDVHGDEVSTLR